jgi:hypothetical protein
MSDYFCSCDVSEGEPCEFEHVNWQKARKQHTCEECQAPILPGEKYARITGAFEGEMFVHKQCEFCHNEFTRIINEQHMCLTYGELACALVAELRGEL